MNRFQTEHSFLPYGPSHWGVLGLTVVGAALLVWLGRKHRGTRGGVTFARAFAVAILAFALAMQIYRLLPGQWNIDISLPLHLSDLTWITAVLALWTRRQWSYSLTYYWGLTLTPQAMITPALDAPDFPHVDFIEFWTQHTLVVWAAIYLTWGLGMRPNWRSYTTAVAATLVWGIAVLGFNSLAGTNYGFLNAKPNNPSLLDFLGEWPWYLGSELALGLFAWALITWPWTRVHPRKTAKQPPAG